jgi:hypothetical protein
LSDHAVAGAGEPAPAIHYASHRELLRPLRPGGRQQLDAIVVSAARDASHLDPSLCLGAALDVPVVVMCSVDANRDSAAARAAGIPGVTCVVIDVDAASVVALPRFETSDFRAPRVGSHGDLSCKRNLGLMLAHLAGWTGILFLDDDISGLRPGQVGQAVAALDHHAAVGMPAFYFQDNSVVCHARRTGGAEQDVFVSGSALAVNAARVASFFPDVYNEDWLFLTPHLDSRAVAVHGSVLQDEYLPFEYPHRAGVQEFGDVLAEGLVGFLHAGPLTPLPPATYWEAFLAARADFIAEATQLCLAAAVGDVDADAALPALDIAAQTLSKISATALMDYVDAWRHDLDSWQQHLGGLPRPRHLGAALAHLGLPAVTVRSRSRADPPPARGQPGRVRPGATSSPRLCAE